MRPLTIIKRWVSGRAVRNVLGLAGALVLLGGNVGAGCFNSNRSSSLDVPLEYRPKSSGDTPVIRIPAGGPPKAYISPTVDKRTDSRLIGQNTEESVPVPVYAAAKTPADFVTDVLRQEMRSAGIEVAADVAAAPRQIDSELLQFRVDESNRYKGEVRLSAKVLDQTGKVLWQGLSVGTAGNFGKSRSITNYQETFSSALQQAIGKILTDPAFTQALSDPAK